MQVLRRTQENIGENGAGNWVGLWKLESHKITSHILYVYLPPSLFLSLSPSFMLFYFCSSYFISLFLQEQFCFLLVLLLIDFGFLVYLPCHGSKFGFDGLNLTRAYYVWIKPFILIMVRKSLTFRLANECGECTT